ncbi:MAG: hypothetical protein IOC54_03900 [Methylobacterium sp.]|nr:hypothetical protein [Methylobacterium sp.]MCA3650965.1 hypothetical protein [Methylobacterium sp.]MCA4922604.1 hypothetical protein [Methylobacterium sp.]
MEWVIMAGSRWMQWREKGEKRAVFVIHRAICLDRAIFCIHQTGGGGSQGHASSERAVFFSTVPPLIQIMAR